MYVWRATYVNDCQGLGVAEDSAAPLSDDPLVDHPKEAPLLGYSKEGIFQAGVLGVYGGSS